MQNDFTKQDAIALRNSCVCLQTRDRARFLTQEYDRIMAPSGLRITQFSFMSILLAGPASIGDLAEAVGIDRTTLTRGLALLQRDEYITLEGGHDARTHVAALTEHGKRATQQAFALWKRAQAQYATSDTEKHNKGNMERV